MFWIIFILLSMGYGFGVMVYLRWLSQTQPSMFHRPLESSAVVIDEPLGHAVAAFQTVVGGPPTAIGTAIRHTTAAGFSTSGANRTDSHNPAEEHEEYLDSPMETRYLDSDPVPYSPYSEMNSDSYSDSYSGSDSEREFTPPISATSQTTAVESDIHSGLPDDILQYFDRDTNRNTDTDNFAAEEDAVRPDDEYPSVEEVPVEMPQEVLLPVESHAPQATISPETPETQASVQREENDEGENSAPIVGIATYSIADIPEEWRQTIAATMVSNSIFRNDGIGGDPNGGTPEFGGSNVLLGNVPPEMSFSDTTILPPKKRKKVTAERP